MAERGSDFAFSASSPLQPLNKRLDENSSPKDPKDLIRAWGVKPSRIPAPGQAAAGPPGTPGEQVLQSKGLFASPLPTPTGHARDEALRGVEVQLEQRLSTELAAQDEGRRWLHRWPRCCPASPCLTSLKSLVSAHALPPPPSPAALSKLAAQEGGSGGHAALAQEVEKRAARVAALETKLSRTRHTMQSLAAAQVTYHEATLQVEAAERRLSSQEQQEEAPPAARGGGGKPRGRGGLDVAALRGELQEATAMMAAAARRVEQMESITDLLVEQLAEREGELAELHSRRDAEAAAHQTEVGRLARERGAIIDEMHASAARADQLEAEDAALRRRLSSLTKQVGALASERAAEAAARGEGEAALRAERAALAETMAAAAAEASGLQAALLAKEEQLAQALEAAKVRRAGEGACDAWGVCDADPAA